MNPKTKTAGAILCLMAMSFFAALPFWKYMSARAVDAAVQARTRTLVDSKPELKPAWDVAMQDEVLTYPEAKVILEAGGETIEPAKG
jgi:hypothetical protein